MEWLTALDESILTGIEAWHSPSLNSVMVFITHLNDNGLLWIAIGLVCLVKREYRKYGITVLLSLLLSLLFTNIIIKNLVQRARPFVTLGYTPLLYETSWSFPSGHTSSSFAAATALTISLKRKGIPFLLLAVLIGFSRIYVRVHYFTDVLAGVVVGSLCGLLATIIVRYAEKHLASIRQ